MQPLCFCSRTQFHDTCIANADEIIAMTSASDYANAQFSFFFFFPSSPPLVSWMDNQLCKEGFGIFNLKFFQHSRFIRSCIFNSRVYIFFFELKSLECRIFSVYTDLVYTDFFGSLIIGLNCWAKRAVKYNSVK